MKNKKLKYLFALMLLFGMHSLTAQSSLQKQQKDIEQRKQYAKQTLLKAKEQQAQQQAERTKETTIQHNTGSGTNPQPNAQPVPATQQKEQIKPQAVAPLRKQKQLTTQPMNAARKENSEQ